MIETFQDKRVWITGASSGFGAALAVEFNNRGAHTVLSARNEANLTRVKEQCRNTAAEVALLPFDATNKELLPDVAAEAEKQYGGVDVFLANAGISQRCLFAETSSEVIDTVLTTNLVSTIHLVRAILPGMQKQGGGTIGVVTSIVGIFGSPLRAVYSASKHGLHGFYESLRAEVWRDNVAVSLIVPGFIRTNISLHSLTGEGVPYGIMDKNQEGGADPRACAKKTINGLARRRRKIYVGLGLKGTASLFVSYFFPSLFYSIIRRTKVT